MTEPRRADCVHDWRVVDRTGVFDGHWWYCTKCRLTEKWR